MKGGIYVFGIKEAHFYLDENEIPMVFIRYCEDGAEKTIRLPVWRTGKGKAEEVSYFIENLLKSYESTNADMAER